MEFKTVRHSLGEGGPCLRSSSDWRASEANPSVPIDVLVREPALQLPL